MGSYNAALDSYTAARRIAPNAFVPAFNLGNVLRKLKRLEDAKRTFTEALALAPDARSRVSALKGLGNVHLILGEFEPGFALWAQARAKAIDRIPIPPWNGEPLAGRTLYVHERQGFGDIIQFSRFLKPLRGGRIVLEAPKTLHRLLAPAFPGVDFAPRNDQPQADLAISLMELPGILGVKRFSDLDGLPTLATEPTSHPAAGRTVAVAWASSRKSGDGDRRSCPFPEFARLFAVPGISFLSLQMGEEKAEADFSRHPNLIDGTAEIRDFADSARLVAAADLTITVDTALAHLAGALGKPVWVLLDDDANWRWHRGETSPWYASARLFRQSAPRQWRDVVRRVAAELRRP
jgi:tetratricopeptide (TPR) repeat protein